MKVIQIDKNVSKPETLYWRGTAQAWGGVLFGAIGGAATANAGKSDAQLMLEFMAKEHIDISEIVYSQVTKQVAATSFFQISDADKSDATMVFSVNMYGFNKTHPLGSNMNPIIRITGKLNKPGGETIWQESEIVSDFASDNDQGQSLETYNKEPAKLKAALEKATEVAVKRVLAKLQ